MDQTKINKNYTKNNGIPTITNKNGRGISVYSMMDLRNITAKRKDGQHIQIAYEVPYFALTIQERLDIFQKCEPVQSVVHARMEKLSGIPWRIVPAKKKQDQILDGYRDLYNLWLEYQGLDNPKYAVIRLRLQQRLLKELPELRPDLGNFERSLIRKKKQINSELSEKTGGIEEWLRQPNQRETWDEFVKKYVFDLMIHGANAVYRTKNKNYKSSYYGLVDDFELMLGGTVIPVSNPYVGGANAYLQLTKFNNAQIFFSDEVFYNSYIPTTAREYGYVPLDALINRISEYLFYDSRMSDEAEGVKPPEKIVVFGENSPFGSLGEELELPLDEGKQKQIETILNEKKKEAVKTLSGVGTPVVLDMSRENIFGLLDQRQEKILRSVMRVFQATPIEIGLAGADDTSGRATSESQERISLSQGQKPMLTMLENDINTEIIPYRYGNNYKIEFQTELNELSEYQKYKLMLETGASINAVQDAKGLARYDGAEYDKPYILGRDNGPDNQQAI